MASWFRPLDAGIWGNAKFRSLSRPQPNAQTLWMYLLTGEHTQGMPGLYAVGLAGMAEILGWSVDDLRRMLTELEQRRMVFVDPEARVVYVPSALQHQPPQNPKHLQGWGNEYRRIPGCELKTRWLCALSTFAHDKGTPWVEALEDGFDSASDTVSDSDVDTVYQSAADTVSPSNTNPNPHSNPNPNPNPQSRGGSGKPDDVPAEDDPIPYAEITAHLNSKSGKHYREGREATRKHIRARWHEGYRLEDFFAVIDGQCAAWLGGDMEKYLRPETLFGSKFESYLNAKGVRPAGRGASTYRDLEIDTPSQEELNAPA